MGGAACASGREGEWNQSWEWLQFEANIVESEANLELAQFWGKLGNAFIVATFPQFAMSSTFPAPSCSLLDKPDLDRGHGDKDDIM